jgi:hypothetical protein
MGLLSKPKIKNSALVANGNTSILPDNTVSLSFPFHKIMFPFRFHVYYFVSVF